MSKKLQEVKEFETKIKELLSQDKKYIGTIVTVSYTCKRTKKKLQREILI